MKEKICQIDAGYFCAGLVFQYNHDIKAWVCVKAAPILKYLTGRLDRECYKQIKKKGWKYQWVS